MYIADASNIAEDPISSEQVPVEAFCADFSEWSVKDDVASMEFPIFSLSKQKDIRIREYTNPTTGKTIRVSPTMDGAATVFDKDLLIFIGSQLIQGRKAGRPVSQYVEVDVSRFLAATGRRVGGRSFELIVAMLRRLKGTSLETNIVTGGKEQLRGFGLIEDYEVTRYTSNKKVLPKSRSRFQNGYSTPSWNMRFLRWIRNILS
ncbi:replication initiator protein A [Pseudomonas asuensis]